MSVFIAIQQADGSSAVSNAHAYQADAYRNFMKEYENNFFRRG